MNRRFTLIIVGLLVVYTGMLFLGTLSPFHFRIDARAVSKGDLTTEWIPFTYWSARCGWPGYFEDKLFNICMFLPFGALLGLIIQSSSKPEKVLLKTTVVSALCSLTIETTQYFLPERHPTASDFLMNSVGGFLGAWLFVRGFEFVSLILKRAP
jgi:glycopeptide antibiotics resistance protein